MASPHLRTGSGLSRSQSHTPFFLNFLQKKQIIIKGELSFREDGGYGHMEHDRIRDLSLGGVKAFGP